MVLRGDERGAAGARVRGVRDLPAGQVRVPDVPDLALGHQLVERGDRLLDRGHRVRGVQLVQVDVVGPQPRERLLHRDLDVAAAALGARGRAVAHVRALVAELGREHDLVPAAREHLAEGELGPAVLAVGFGGVEERDARVDRRVDHRAGPLQVEAAAEVVAAEADHRDEQPGVTEGSIAHGRHHTDARRTSRTAAWRRRGRRAGAARAGGALLTMLLTKGPANRPRAGITDAMARGTALSCGRVNSVIHGCKFPPRPGILGHPAAGATLSAGPGPGRRRPPAGPRRGTGWRMISLSENLA